MGLLVVVHAIIIGATLVCPVTQTDATPLAFLQRVPRRLLVYAVATLGSGWPLFLFV